MPVRAARVGRVGVIGAAGGEDRGRGQGRHARPVARRQDRGRGRGGHTGSGSSADLAAGYRFPRGIGSRASSASRTTPISAASRT